MTRLYPDVPEEGIFRHIEGSLTLLGTHSEPDGDGRTWPLAAIVGTAHRGKWSNAHALQIGDRVRVTFNQLGTGMVVAYHLEAGFIGLEIKPDARPAWHVKQCGDRHPHYLFFGAEVVKL